MRSFSCVLSRSRFCSASLIQCFFTNLPVGHYFGGHNANSHENQTLPDAKIAKIPKIGFTMREQMAKPIQSGVFLCRSGSSWAMGRIQVDVDGVQKEQRLGWLPLRLPDWEGHGCSFSLISYPQPSCPQLLYCDILISANETTHLLIF